jgi:hypothetical protein
MRYTFTSPDAPSARRTQLYQMPDWRAIYHDGWKAVAGAGSDRWELYHVSADRAEIRNVAARYPEKLAELASLWEAEAAAGRDALASEGPERPELTGSWPPRPGRPAGRARDLDAGAPRKAPVSVIAPAGASASLDASHR